MLKKVASTKLLSGLFVAGGILGMNQAAKQVTCQFRSNKTSY